jgi:type IV secretion system protein VirB4
MFLGTQSPRDALNSPIAHVIKEQCPSQFYFRNEKADWSDYGPEGFGLSRTEYEIVRTLPLQSGECLLKQGAISVRVQMPMRGLVDELNILSGREANTKVFDEVLSEVGANALPTALINRFQNKLRERVSA